EGEGLVMTAPRPHSLLERANISQGTPPSGSLTPIQAEVDTAVSEFFGPSHSTPVSTFTEIDRISGRINQVGAVLGFVSLMASFSNRTRPFSSAAIRLLSTPTVSGLLLASGGYSLVRQAPHTLHAGLRVFGSYEGDTRHSRLKDLLEGGAFGVGALGIAMGAGSFVVGGKKFFAVRQAQLESGVSRPAANQTAYMQADAARRAFQDPDAWIVLARGSTRLTTLERFRIERAADITQWTLPGGPG